jgi:hypothetical protein
VYEQQVLDNIAKFVHDYHSLPEFGLLKDGLSNLTDTAEGNGSLSFVRDGFANGGFGGRLSRARQQNWQLVPVNDPQRLALMRCAFQKAVAGCGHGDPSCICPDCDGLFNKFYSGSTAPRDPSKLPGGASAPAHVTADCIGHQCWFCVGGKHDVPKEPCVRVGHHCGVYIWVPKSGTNELTKLTLVILDFALNSPPAGRKKLVKLYLDKNGNAATNLLHQAEVIVEIPMEDSIKSVQEDSDAFRAQSKTRSFAEGEPSSSLFIESAPWRDPTGLAPSPSLPQLQQQIDRFGR